MTGAASPVLFVTKGLRAFELRPGDEPRLQRFFDGNPAYFELVGGRPAAPGEAHEEMHGALPAGWPFTKKWVLGLAPDGAARGAIDELDAMANVVSDLLAPHVWHVGLFIVATRLHGRGIAGPVYAALEAWMRRHGARWIRLGVVRGNARAEAFWQRAGFAEVRTRDDVEVGARRVTIRVMAKSLAGEGLDDYLALVPRDRVEAARGG